MTTSFRAVNLQNTRRFAFFDRKNLALPSAVVKDLVPAATSPSGNAPTAATALASSGGNSSDGPLDPPLLFPEGEYFTLVAATNVSLPSTLSASLSERGDGAMAVKRGAGGDGAPAMQASLQTISHAANTNSGGGDGGLQLLFASSRNTSLVHVVDVTVRCTPKNPHHHTSNNHTGSMDMTMIGGGTGSNYGGFNSSAFASKSGGVDSSSSPNSGDANSKKNDPNVNATTTNTNNTTTTNITSIMMTNPEELDGWRGHYNPFVSANAFIHDTTTTPKSTSSADHKRNASSSSSAAAATTSAASGLSVQGTSSSLAAAAEAAIQSLTKKGAIAITGSSTAETEESSSTRIRKKGSAKERRILDEHLGGSSTGGGGKDGGSATANTTTAAGFESGASLLFASSPFAQQNKDVIDSTGSVAATSVNTTFTSSTTSGNGGGGGGNAANKKARIVSLATCSGSSSGSSGPSKNESTLYVAAITDAPNTVGIVVHTNPHLMLSAISPSLLKSSTTTDNKTMMGMYSTYYKPTSGKFNQSSHGKPRCVSILPGVVCVGTDTGHVLVYVFNCDLLDTAAGNVADGYGKLSLVAEIPAPKGGMVVENKGGNSTSSNEQSGGGGGVGSIYSVSSLELIGRPMSSSSSNEGIVSGGGAAVYKLFVTYRRRLVQSPSSSQTHPVGGATSASPTGPTGGICCFELGGLRIPGKVAPPVVGQASNAPVVSSRYDLDGRDVGTSCLCDIISLPPEDWMMNYSTGEGGGLPRVDSSKNETGEDALALSADSIEKMLPRFMVARVDGLHLYSTSEKVGVCPVDGNKIAVCSLPSPPVLVYLRRPLRRRLDADNNEGRVDDPIREAGASYALVATTDSKSGRDAVDIYDITNKLVGFHVLLSPGHRALRTVGIASSPTVNGGNLIRGGRSSAVVLTSGGSIVTLVEKTTPDKVDLLLQKNLYAAAISMAYADPQFYRPEDITALYRRYAEHLYRKGDFLSSMDQYILTIGSLESSHVIFRFLDAPKIPLVVKYLEALRAQGLSSTVHDELLRTCYLKLNDPESAGKIIVRSSSSINAVSFPLNPDGTQAPSVPISRNIHVSDDPSEMLSAICSLQAPEAVEAIVTHGSSLARSLPRETAGVVIALCDGSYSPSALADAAAGRPSVTDSQKDGAYKYPFSLFSNAFQENPKLLRLILSHCRRNNCALTPILRRTLLELTLDEWSAAKRSGDSHIERTRQMEAMMLLSDHHDMGDYEALVIVHAAEFSDGEIFLYEKLNMVPMLIEQYGASGTERARRQMLALCERDPELCPEVLAHFVKMYGDRAVNEVAEDASVNSDSDVGGLLTDIHEALMLIRDHGVLPAVRVLRILSGETHGKFSADIKSQQGNQSSVPLSAAIDYVGSVLDESSNKIDRLLIKVEEYNRLCNEMELEINSLLSLNSSTKRKKNGPNVDIDDVYSRLLSFSDGSQAQMIESDDLQETKKEEFWRELEQSEDPFETICFFISKGYLENV